MNTIAGFGLCTLTDQELLDKVDSMTDEIYKECARNRDGKMPYILARHIPARPNDDYDLLIGELLLRFKERL